MKRVFFFNELSSWTWLSRCTFNMAVLNVSSEQVSNPCIKNTNCACTCNHTDYAVKFLKLVLCLSLMLTVVSVSACVIAVRSALFAQEQLRQLQRENRYRPKEQTADIRPVHDTLLQFLQAEDSSPYLHQSGGRMNTSRDRRSASKSKKQRKGKRKAKNNNRKFCKKVSKCSSAPETPKRELVASEFQVDGLSVNDHNIGAFQPAKWMSANTETVKQAARAIGNEISVSESGVYLVYSSVLFNDTKYREGLVVQRNGLTLLRCFDGVDHIDTSKDRTQNFKFKTCSVSGVTYLSEGDTLRMFNLYPDTNLDTSHGSTFIGLIQLIPALKTTG